jgi:phage shock protein A
MAVSENKDDLAKKALQKKKTMSEKADMIERQLEEEISLGKKMKSELILLEDKIQEARTKRDTLLAKKQAADTRQRFTENTRKWSGTEEKIINGFHKLDVYEHEKDTLDAVRETNSELQEEEIEETFQKMKEKKIWRMSLPS